MARPASRRRRRDEEEEEDEGAGRRGRRAARPSGPNPVTLVLGGVVLVLIVVAVIMGTSGDKPQPVQDKPALGPPPPPPPPTGPVDEPPKPLTAEETAEINRVFEQAQPDVDAFLRLKDEGWKKKNEEEDNDGANDAWVQAEEHYKAAMRIVNEIMEDEDRFPERRQTEFMTRWIDKVATWQKARSSIPKVNFK